MLQTVSNGFKSSFELTMTSKTPSCYKYSICERLGARECTETSEQGPQVPPADAVIVEFWRLGSFSVPEEISLACYRDTDCRYTTRTSTSTHRTRYSNRPL